MGKKNNERIEYIRKIRQKSMHHILNKCRSDLFNVHIEWNKTPMNRLEHDYWHLCHNNEHPLESLQSMYWFTQVMSSKAKDLYDTLCNMSKEEFYDNKFLFLPNRWKKRY